MNHRWLLIVSIVSTLATPASAHSLIIPAAANTDGVNQTRWRTDLQVMAAGSEPVTFTVELLRTGEDNTDPVSIDRSVAPDSSLRLANLLETEFGFVGTAALRVRATDGEIRVNSRTFNDDPTGTYGQTVPAVPETRATEFGGHATLIQLSRSSDPASGFRTNIGFVSMVAQPIVVTVDLFDATGSSLGTVTRSLQAFEHRQINDAFRAVGSDAVDDGYAVVSTPTRGGRFVSYASVVDNGSGDAVFIVGENDPGAGSSQDRLVVLEAFMRPG